MVNRTKSKRSRYIKSRKFRKSGGANPTSEGTKKNFKNRLMGIKGRLMGSMPNSSMPKSSMKNVFGKARGMFKNMPSLRKKKQQNSTGVVPADPTDRDHIVQRVVVPPKPEKPFAAGPSLVDPVQQKPVVAGPSLVDPVQQKPVAAGPPPAGPVPPSADLVEGDKADELRPPSGVDSGPNVGGKRNRYKKSKKGGRRTRKSRKLRRSRRR